MKIKVTSITTHSIQVRNYAIITIANSEGAQASGEIAPLPGWSQETLEEALEECFQKKQRVEELDWTFSNCFAHIQALNLYPSVAFGLESAILSFLLPPSSYAPPISALLMGSLEDILKQAERRHREGFFSAKLKVSNLTFEEASFLIHKLKSLFSLRIDVNCAWKTKESLDFFAQFPKDAFDYIEEPFQNPYDLAKFTHPLAIDESFPKILSLKDLESLPTLKALVYKPTMQGGLTYLLPIHEWTLKQNIYLVLSSSFESPLGLSHIASLGKYLALKSPLGLGTYHHMVAKN
jgi:O-succinylbenzoate synthase